MAILEAILGLAFFIWTIYAIRKSEEKKKAEMLSRMRKRQEEEATARKEKLETIYKNIYSNSHQSARQSLCSPTQQRTPHNPSSGNPSKMPVSSVKTALIPPSTPVFTAELVSPTTQVSQTVQKPIQLPTQFDTLMLKFLHENGIEYIDNRKKNGALWIIGEHYLDHIVEDCKYRFGVKFTFKSEGGQCTKHRPAWWTRSYASKNIIITDAPPQITRSKKTKQLEGQTSIEDILLRNSNRDQTLLDAALHQRQILSEKREQIWNAYRALENQYNENKKILDKMPTNQQLERDIVAEKLGQNAANALKQVRNDAIDIVTAASKEKSKLKKVINSYDAQLSELSKKIESLSESLGQSH